MQATPDRSLLITADAGPKASLLVFWDPATGQPISTVQDPHAGGVISMAVSADGRQLATIGAPTQDSEGSQQEVCAKLMCHCNRLCPWCKHTSYNVRLPQLAAQIHTQACDMSPANNMQQEAWLHMPCCSSRFVLGMKRSVLLPWPAGVCLGHQHSKQCIIKSVAACVHYSSACR